MKKLFILALATSSIIAKITIDNQSSSIVSVQGDIHECIIPVIAKDDCSKAIIRELKLNRNLNRKANLSLDKSNFRSDGVYNYKKELLNISFLDWKTSKQVSSPLQDNATYTLTDDLKPPYELQVSIS